MAYVLKKYVEGLEELNTHIASWLLTQDVQEEGKHIFLQEEAEQTHTQTHTGIHHDLDCNYIIFSCGDAVSQYNAVSHY